MNKDPAPVLLKSTSRSKFTFEMGNLLAALVALSMMVLCHCHRRAEVQGNGRSSTDMKSTALDNSHMVPFLRSVLKKYQPKYPAFLNFQHLLLLLRHNALDRSPRGLEIPMGSTCPLPLCPPCPVKPPGHSPLYVLQVEILISYALIKM